MPAPDSAPSALPHPVATLDAVDAVERAGARFETPCGDGAMVWRRWGDGGRPVVLLHGGAGSWTHWVRNLRALVAAGREVWVPDLPGFGESAAEPDAHDADALHEPIERGLRQLLGDQPCELVGFSFGSLAAGFLLQHYPERARRLVVVGAPSLAPGLVQPLELRAWRHVPPGAERDRILRANLKALMLAGPEGDGDFALALHRSNIERDRMHRRRLARTDALGRVLAAAKCPVHGIWGAFDALYRDRQPALAAAFGVLASPDRYTSIAGSGHWVQFEQADAFDAALARALG